MCQQAVSMCVTEDHNSRYHDKSADELFISDLTFCTCALVSLSVLLEEQLSVVQL